MATVLVVEDEFGIVELFDAVLTDEGYQVLTAMNGRDGLELLAREQPQLVFCDFMMPVMDGAGMLGAMAANSALRGIPVVMMSSMPEAVVAERCSGDVAFMRKPFKLFELLDVVERVLGKSDGRAS
jgi:CheY-like chemotaxis protein